MSKSLPSGPVVKIQTDKVGKIQWFGNVYLTSPIIICQNRNDFTVTEMRTDQNQSRLRKHHRYYGPTAFAFPVFRRRPFLNKVMVTLNAS